MISELSPIISKHIRQHSDRFVSQLIARQEGHYASVFYSHFAAQGLRVIVEDVSNHGKVDMSVEFNSAIYVFEFKMVEDKPKAKHASKSKRKVTRKDIEANRRI